MNSLEIYLVNCYPYQANMLLLVIYISGWRNPVTFMQQDQGIEEFNLTQHVCIPTYYAGNTLDVVLGMICQLFQYLLPILRTQSTVMYVLPYLILHLVLLKSMSLIENVTLVMYLWYKQIWRTHSRISLSTCTVRNLNTTLVDIIYNNTTEMFGVFKVRADQTLFSDLKVNLTGNT